MFTYKEISLIEPVTQKCAQMIHQFSWGFDYPVDALSELMQAKYIYGCFDGEKLVGCASVTHVASPDGIDNEKPWFADWVVLPEYRRQGIGTLLYKGCMEYLKNEEIVFSCTDNPLVEKFFLKKGWAFNRITKDESGGTCKVFSIRPLVIK